MPFPYFLRPWLGSPFPDPVDANFVWVPGLGLPILAECSDPNWVAGDFVPTENTIGVARNNPNVLQMPAVPNYDCRGRPASMRGQTLTHGINPKLTH